MNAPNNKNGQLPPVTEEAVTGVTIVVAGDEDLTVVPIRHTAYRGQTLPKFSDATPEQLEGVTVVAEPLDG